MFGPFAYIGTQEIIVIAVVVLVLFGGSRIPQFAKGFGEGIREFKKSLSGEDKDDSAKTDGAPVAGKPVEEK